MQGTTKFFPNAFIFISLFLSQIGFTQVLKRDPDQ